MKIHTMRFVDRYLGIPLCWLLGAYCRSFGDAQRRRHTNDVRKILVIKFFGMGSIILITPALSLIKKEFPGAKLSFLSFQTNRELLERIPMIDEILIVDRSSFASFLRSTVSVVSTLVRTHSDVVFDMEFFSKYSTLLSGLSQAHIRVGFALPTVWRSLIVTHQVPLDKTRHVINSFCALIQAVTELRQKPPAIVPPLITDSDHDSLLAKYPLDGRSLITINVNSGDTFLERRWQGNRFASLVSRLSKENDCLFCFIGHAEESTYVRNIILEVDCEDRCVDTSGHLTIPELGALLQRSDLLISNDSGPLHLAASLGTPVIGLYGPESPDFYGANYAEGSIVYKRITCSPCMNVYSAKEFRCPYDARCMREISVEDVYRHAISFALID